MSKPIKDPQHPLAARNGYVAAHRHALYEKLGPGPQKCHNCPRTLGWHEILITNIDGVDLISCASCIRHRVHPKKIQDGEPVFVNRNGRRSRGVARTCERCQASFTVEAANARANPKVGRFCSGRCRSIHVNLENSAKRRAAQA